MGRTRVSAKSELCTNLASVIPVGEFGSINSSIAIIEPKNQELIVGKTKISAKVKIDDPDLLDRVEFVIGDEVIFVDREPPFECFYDFGEESRSWIVRAIA